MRRVMICGVVLALASCSNSPSDATTEGNVASVAVSPANSSVSIGARLSLQAVVQDTTGQTINDADIFWSTENPSIAIISADGVVTGIAPGTTRISASVAGKSGLGTVVVLPAPVARVAVASVSISPSNPPAIAKNENLSLTAVLKEASGKVIDLGRVVTWTSSDPSIASVTPKTGSYSATVKGNKEGTAIITATSEGKSASVTVTVKH